MTTLNNSQLNTLRTFVQQSTEPAIVQARTEGATGTLRDLLNAEAPGPVLAWGVVSRAALTEACVDNISQYDNVAAGKRDAFRMMLELPIIDGGRAKIRNGINATIAAAQDNDVRNLRRGLLSALRVNATVAQNAVGGTTITVDTIAGLRRDYEGLLDIDDARAILAA